MGFHALARGEPHGVEALILPRAGDGSCRGSQHHGKDQKNVSLGHDASVMTRGASRRPMKDRKTHNTIGLCHFTATVVVHRNLLPAVLNQAS
jgi:hypothetical protein